MENTEENKEKITYEEAKEEMQKRLVELREKRKEAREAMAQGKGRLTLETPIRGRDVDITELSYDFTAISGLEYISSMDMDLMNTQNYRITHRQALALFATAAAKETENLDVQDIMERIGGSDALTAIQLATDFFVASTRAGQLRISKK